VSRKQGVVIYKQNTKFILHKIDLNKNHVTTGCWRLEILSNEIMETFVLKGPQKFKLSTKMEQGPHVFF
jgi:hypothetical protein